MIAHHLERRFSAGKHDRGLARLVEIKLALGLFPWNTRAALSSVLGGEKIAQVFEVFDSLSQAGHFGREFSQHRLVRFLQGASFGPGIDDANATTFEIVGIACRNRSSARTGDCRYHGVKL